MNFHGDNKNSYKLVIFALALTSFIVFPNAVSADGSEATASAQPETGAISSILPTAALGTILIAGGALFLKAPQAR